MRSLLTVDAASQIRIANDPGEGRSNPLICKLESLAPLSQADQSVLEQVSAASYSLGQNTDLVREGESLESAFLILEGFACRYRLRADGARQIMSYLVPGDLCDPDGTFLSRADHTIGTLSRCRVVRIPHDALQPLMERHPGIVHALRLAKLVEEATLRERLVSLGCRSAIERVAHLFCELLVRHQAAGLATQNSFPLPITQVDLADALGLSNVHVNRVLQDLRKQRLVELRRKALTILNLPRLKALAEFRADYLHAMAAEKERPVPEKASRPRDALTAYP